MQFIQRFTRSTLGMIATAMLSLALLATAVDALRNFVHGDAIDAAKTTWYVDRETGQAFGHTPVLGESPPIKSPFTGKMTGYRGEACYWTADGQPKTTPTWVLLNSTFGKPGPTFCPDCGRLVVGHNPGPDDNRPAPPTKAEYLASHPSNDPAAPVRR